MKIQEEIITLVALAAKTTGVDVMLVGAYARDYWREHFQVPGRLRATCDVDFACQVMSWGDFFALLECLKSKYGLSADRGLKHRLWLRDEISLDLLPYGDITDQDDEVAWPPDFETTLCVLGYAAAKKDGAIVHVGGCSIKVIRPHWLALLKLLAYTENTTRTKDLIDVYYLVDNYFDFIDEDLRLYSVAASDADLLEEDDFDSRVAGTRMIVRDCAGTSSDDTRRILAKIAKFNQHDRLTLEFARINGLETDIAHRIISGLQAEV